MAVEAHGPELTGVVVLLAAGVVAAPLFKRAGLGSVIGYLVAGLAIGPFGLGLFNESETILHIAELGVVMFLFVIGLEMKPSRLWNLRGEIFGLGAAQVTACGILLTLAGIAFGLPPVVAFVAAMGFVLSSTAMAMQILEERGDTATAPGQRIVSILLLEDLAIVPLLVLVAFLGPASAAGGGTAQWLEIAVAIGSIVGLLAAGRWLLNPMFGLLAAARAREVMTAAALLVVLGAALLMQLGGLSMAMGAFLAGVMLSESSFRHQLEADIEPFRGILLGLFFLAVGMSLDLGVIVQSWPVIIGGVAVFMVVKSIGIYAVARLFRAAHEEALQRMAIMAQGGEFAFVLYAAAAAAGILDGGTNAVLTAIVILSMVLTPFAVLSLRWALPPSRPSMDGVEAAEGLRADVLVIGFGRFAQITAQALLARGFEVSIIESDTDMIRSAARFGFKVYYGDGTRLDILHHSGAGEARAILVCVDDPDVADRIVELVKSEFPLARLLVRAYDRAHAIRLIAAGVDFQIRETLESAMAFGEAALRELGVDPEEAAETVIDVRRRDLERLELQIVGGLKAGNGLLRGNLPQPTPLTTPKRPGRVMSGETGVAVADSEAAAGT